MLVNLLGKPLKICGCSPITGWYLDGYCKTDRSDWGNHSVCSVVTETFLRYTKSQGNNLIDPNPFLEFPGLKAGDHWCLCAQRWEEAIQYGAALSPMNLDAEDCLRIINSMEERLWSDDVTHYYLTCIIGLRRFSEKSYLVRSALSETTPQYTKSRVAAAWAYLKLELYDQLDLLYQLSNSAYWKPLRWSCQQVFARMIDQQQSQKER